jgi:hypothetical protein
MDAGLDDEDAASPYPTVTVSSEKERASLLPNSHLSRERRSLKKTAVFYLILEAWKSDVGEMRGLMSGRSIFKRACFTETVCI